MKRAVLSILIISGICLASPFLDRAFARQKKEVVVMDFAVSPARQNSGKLPKGWTLKVWRGRADIRLIRDGDKGAKVLRMRSDKSSASVYREMQLNPRKYPVFSWKWKVTKLPRGADARNGESDDQAAGIYVVFPRFPSFFNSRLVGYVWETNAPVGTILRSRKNPMVHYIVVRSGVGNLDQWITEKRNVMDDYRRVFGSDPPEVGGVALMIDADDTRSDAESYFAQIEFKGRDASLASAEHQDIWIARAISPSTWRSYE